MVVECTHCGKTFTSEISLEQHVNAKHGSKYVDKVPKKTNITFLIALAVIVFIAILGAQWYFSQQSSLDSYNTFAQCLTEKGAKFYGTFWCPP